MNSKDSHQVSYEEFLQGTKDVLVASQQETKQYTVRVAGRDFLVLPNVFSPKYFFDTEIFATHLPVMKGEDVLEIGPGTGAISITLAYQGARRVVAIDINPDAVANTRQNIALHNMGAIVDVRQGNLYDALKEEEQFDVIFWNTPFGLLDDKDILDIEKSVYDPGYKATERFIKEARNHLKVGGRVLIGFSTTLGRLDLLQKFVTEAGMVMRLVYKEESVETNPVTFEIFEAK